MDNRRIYLHLRLGVLFFRGEGERKERELFFSTIQKFTLTLRRSDFSMLFSL